MNTSVGKTSKALRIMATVIVVIMALILLTACNPSSKVRYSHAEYNLYIVGYSFSDDGETVTAMLAFSGAEDKKLSTNVVWDTQTYAKSLWYNRQDVAIRLKPSLVCEQVRALTSEDDMTKEEKYYPNLKIALRYDTIYKSIQSDGDVIKYGRSYLHLFTLDEDESDHIYSLWLQTQNSANWYTMLISSCIIAGVALLAIFIAIKGQYGKRKK